MGNDDVSTQLKLDNSTLRRLESSINVPIVMRFSQKIKFIHITVTKRNVTKSNGSVFRRIAGRQRQSDPPPSKDDKKGEKKAHREI